MTNPRSQPNQGWVDVVCKFAAPPPTLGILHPPHNLPQPSSNLSSLTPYQLQALQNHTMDQITIMQDDAALNSSVPQLYLLAQQLEGRSSVEELTNRLMPSWKLKAPCQTSYLAAKDDELLEQYIPGVNSLKLVDLKSVASIGRPLRRSLEAISWAAKSQIILFTSFYELEPQYIDALQSELKLPVHAVGPCIPYMKLRDKQPRKEDSADHYLNWLDTQKENSVLYVSLGSFLSVSTAQLEEIAMGLRDSKVKFLWIARSNSTIMQEMAGSMGLVVPWCDQLRVLCHPSVGGFFTHCGWNSTLEGVFSGVPMITFPIFWDQPPGSRLIVDQWKVGLSLKEKVGKNGTVSRQEIADTIRKLMDSDHSSGSSSSSDVTEIRRRSQELRTAALKAIEEGGSSDNSINAFLQSLMRSSRKNSQSCGVSFAADE